MCTMIADMTRGRTIFSARLARRRRRFRLHCWPAAAPSRSSAMTRAWRPRRSRSAARPLSPRSARRKPVVEEKQKTPTVAAKQPAEPEPPVEQPAPPAPVYTASELMGKSEDEVTALMGAPARVEQRAASTVWVYQGGDCGLDVFFFLDMATSDERVLTVAPNSQPATTAAPTAASSESQSASAGQPAASAAADAAATSEGTAVDACYGKLRRS